MSTSPCGITRLNQADIYLVQTLPYDHLLRTLEIPSVRDLEDLIIDAMYNNVLGGKLNQERGTLSVDWVIGRDVSRVGGGMEEVQRKLAAWLVAADNQFPAFRICIDLVSFRTAGATMLKGSSTRSIDRSPTQKPNPLETAK